MYALFWSGPNPTETLSASRRPHPALSTHPKCLQIALKLTTAPTGETEARKGGVFPRTSSKWWQSWGQLWDVQALCEPVLVQTGSWWAGGALTGGARWFSACPAQSSVPLTALTAKYHASALPSYVLTALVPQKNSNRAFTRICLDTHTSAWVSV